MGKIEFKKLPGQDGRVVVYEGSDVVPEVVISATPGPNGIAGGPNEVRLSAYAEVEPGGDAGFLRVRESSISGEWKTDRAHESEWAECHIELPRNSWAACWDIRRLLIDHTTLTWDGDTNTLSESISFRGYCGDYSINGNNPLSFDFSDDRELAVDMEQ